MGLSRTFQINQLFADLSPLESIALAVSEQRGEGHALVELARARRVRRERKSRRCCSASIWPT